MYEEEWDLRERYEDRTETTETRNPKILRLCFSARNLGITVQARYLHMQLASNTQAVTFQQWVTVLNEEDQRENASDWACSQDTGDKERW